MKKSLCMMLWGTAGFFLLCLSAWASEGGAAPGLNEARQVAQYNYAIHILAMLLVAIAVLMLLLGDNPVAGVAAILEGRQETPPAFSMTKVSSTTKRTTSWVIASRAPECS